MSTRWAAGPDCFRGNERSACRGGPPAGSNFVDHAGLLTEVCLLGNVARRAGKKILWDGSRMRVTNDEKANQLLHREYRQGWSL